MPLPKDIKFITFDCYGTLIDWETGVYEAFQKEADRDGFTIDRDVLIPRFIEIQREIQRGSYELYAEVLRRTAVRVAERARLGAGALALQLPARQRPALAARSARPTPSSSGSRRSTSSGSCRTSTTSCSAPTRRHFRMRLRPRRHRPAGAQLQAGPGPLQGVRAADRRAEEELGPHRVGLPDRRRAVPEVEDPGDLGQPPRRGARGRPEEADRGGQDLPRRGEAAQAA